MNCTELVAFDKYLLGTKEDELTSQEVGYIQFEQSEKEQFEKGRMHFEQYSLEGHYFVFLCMIVAVFEAGVGVGVFDL